MAFFRNIQHLENIVNDATKHGILIEARNETIEVSFNYVMTSKEQIREDLKAVQQIFPKAFIKGRKYLVIHVPYQFIDNNRIVAENLHGFRFEA